MSLKPVVRLWAAVRDLGAGRDAVRAASARRLRHVLRAKPLHRFAVATVGALLIAFGASMTIVAELGVGPMDMVITGLRNSFNMSATAASWSILGVMSVVAVLLGGRPTIGGLYTMMCVGGFFSVAFATIPEVSDGPIPERAFMFVVGLLLIVLGVEISAIAGLGRGTTEVIQGRIELLTGIDRRLIRTGLELLMFAVGLLLGGQFGIGTVVIALSIGPMLAAMNDLVVDAVEGRRMRVGQPARPVAAAVPVRR